MAVFYIYTPNGGNYSHSEMEYSPNAEVPKRELSDRVRTGNGVACYVADMEELNHRSAYKARRGKTWEPATGQARMVVWRVKGAVSLPSDPPTETWAYSGATDRPTTAAWVPETPQGTELPDLAGMRVPGDVYRRRISLGWDEDRARSTPMEGYSLSPKHSPEGRRWNNREAAIPPILVSAFGISRTYRDWAVNTGLSESALRQGESVHGLEGYLRRRGWSPGKGPLR